MGNNTTDPLALNRLARACRVIGVVWEWGPVFEETASKMSGFMQARAVPVVPVVSPFSDV
jgi:hypothetical protein